jgi:protein SCO1
MNVVFQGRNRLVLLTLTLLAVVPLAGAQGLNQGLAPRGIPAQERPSELNNVGIDQKLNAQVPLNLPFRDETGQPVTLQKYFNNKPVVLALVYYDCPMLCTQVLNGMTSTLRKVNFQMGKDYDVVTVSFDPKETPQLAAAKKAVYLERLGQPGAAQGWHFLTGPEDSIQKLTSAVGFHYVWDPKTQVFNHATAIMILTPQGKVSKYFYGVEYLPQDFRFGLIQASNNEIGTPVDRILLYCCKYNVSTGKYDLFVSRLLAIAGVIIMGAVGAFLFVMFKIGPKRRPTDGEAEKSNSAKIA